MPDIKSMSKEELVSLLSQMQEKITAGEEDRKTLRAEIQELRSLLKKKPPEKKEKGFLDSLFSDPLEEEEEPDLDDLDIDDHEDSDKKK